MKRLSLFLLGAAALAFAAAPLLLPAQTVRVVSKADSALIITTLPRCTSACPDSVQLRTVYGGATIVHTLKAKSVDTVRVARLSVVASVSVVPLPYKASAALTASVPAYVAPVAPTPPPVVIATPPTTPATPVSYVVPTLPQAFVDVSYPQTTRTTRIAAGADLQAALDAAQPGDELVLANGAVFRGNYVLRVKTGTATIVIRGETCTAPGIRRDTTGNAAVVATPNQDAAFLTEAGAAHYRLACFTVAHVPDNPAVLNYGIIVLGQGPEIALADQPYNIVLDRMYVHGATNASNRRCVAFNGRALAVVDSWLAECHAKGFDAQGIGGWGGGGPFLIENNRIEASGQAILFGGADPRILNVSPSDITIRHNYLYKPLAWGGGVWTVKATFELKHGRRVLFEGNVLENHWADAQVGYAILFQTLADDNSSWNWTTVQDVTVRDNVIRNSTGGINMLARVAYNGGTLPTNPTSRVLVVNNLFQDVGRDPIASGPGRVFQLLADLHDVTLLNNTITCTCTAQTAVMFDGWTSHTVIVGNVFPATEYGFFGNSVGVGRAALTAYAADGVATGNVLLAQRSDLYPAGNWFALPAPSGVDMARLNAAIAGVVKP